MFGLIHVLAKLSSQLGNRNITHDTELWDSDHYVLLLADVNQFPTILGVNSYV